MKTKGASVRLFVEGKEIGFATGISTLSRELQIQQSITALTPPDERPERLQMMFSTVNERRAELGLPPLGDLEIRALGWNGS